MSKKKQAKLVWPKTKATIPANSTCYIGSLAALRIGKLEYAVIAPDTDTLEKAWDDLFCGIHPLNKDHIQEVVIFSQKAMRQAP